MNDAMDVNDAAFLDLIHKMTKEEKLRLNGILVRINMMSDEEAKRFLLLNVVSSNDILGLED